jgi:hypothetical protein
MWERKENQRANEKAMYETVWSSQWRWRWYPQALDSSSYNLCPSWKNAHPICLVMSSWRQTLSLKKASSWMQILNFQRLAKMEVLSGQGRQSLYKCSTYCYQFQSQSNCWIIVILQCARYFHCVYHFHFFLNWPKVHACLSLSLCPLIWREHLKGHLAWRESHYPCTKLVVSKRPCKNISHIQV